MNEIPKKEYTVTFTLKVPASDESEAIENAERLMAEGLYELPPTVEEGECVDCHGTGEVSCDEDDGEGHIMRGVGTRKCPCKED